MRRDERRSPARAAPSSEEPARELLAARAGILASYVGHQGERRVSEETRRALLAALGLPAANEREARESLRRLDAELRARLLAPARVLLSRTRATPLPVARPESMRGKLLWRAELHGEAGEVRRFTGRTPAQAAAIDLHLPPLGPGYYELSLELAGAQRTVREQQMLIVAPRSAFTPEEAGAAGSFGLTANLYSVRSRRNLGIGDLGDLAALVRWAGVLGASFVGVNPLHALRLDEGEFSPYSPDSRLYRSPIYLDIEAIPELAEAPALQRRLQSAEFRARSAALRRAPRLDYAAVWAMKEPLLRELHRVFTRCTWDAERRCAFRDFVASQGKALDDYATYRAIAAQYGGDWRRWPAALQDPRSAAVARFRTHHASEVELQRFLQLELDRQLGRAARAAALPIGLYQDLAIGSSPAGSDTWSFPGTFVRGVHLGAPPDAFQVAGQDWRLPPLDPLRLARDGYRYWILLLRAAFRHAGALRIDHILGLMRQYWIPTGFPPSEGAYIRFPFDDLAAIVALESRRARAVVIGEDLGTVPPGFRRRLARWGILGSSVLLFERGRRGEFLPPRRYPSRVLVSANTHDLPSIRSFFEGADLRLRRRVGAIASDAELAVQQRVRGRERIALRRLLEEQGGLPRGHGAAADGRLRGAVHALLARSSAPLVAVALDDLSGEREPVNLPGIDASRFPSWTRRMSISLERLRRDPEVARSLAPIRRLRGRKRRASFSAPARLRGL